MVIPISDGSPVSAGLSGAATGGLVGAGLGIAGNLLSASGDKAREAAVAAALAKRSGTLAQINLEREGLRRGQQGVLSQSQQAFRAGIDPAIAAISNRQGAFQAGVAERGTALQTALDGAQRSSAADSLGFLSRARGVQSGLTGARQDLANSRFGDLSANTASTNALRALGQSEQNRGRVTKNKLGDISSLRGRADLDDLLSQLQFQAEISQTENVGARRSAFGQLLTGAGQAAPGVISGFFG